MIEPTSVYLREKIRLYDYKSNYDTEENKQHAELAKVMCDVEFNKVTGLAEAREYLKERFLFNQGHNYDGELWNKVDFCYQQTKKYCDYAIDEINDTKNLDRVRHWVKSAEDCLDELRKYALPLTA